MKRVWHYITLGCKVNSLGKRYAHIYKMKGYKGVNFNKADVYGNQYCTVTKT